VRRSEARGANLIERQHLLQRFAHRIIVFDNSYDLRRQLPLRTSVLAGRRGVGVCPHGWADKTYSAGKCTRC
jgi:hypothetical protein